MNHKDITGQVFGVLMVERMEKDRTHYKAWCRCLNCGKEKLCEPANLRKITNSGCRCVARKRKPVLDDLSEKRFGLLKVTRMEQRGSAGQYYAICECSCGTSNHPVLPGALKRGATTSCGCRRDQYLKNTGKNSAQFTGFEEIGGRLVSCIKRRAKARGYEFALTAEQLWKKYLEQEKKCALSDTALTIGKKNKETTASLDRIDSTCGYTIDNVQWVHKKINIMKNVFEQKEFIHFCCLIARRHQCPSSI